MPCAVPRLRGGCAADGRVCCASQEQLVINALQYYLTMAELEKDESY